MDCRQINDYIFDYYDNSLSPELRQLVEEHVQKCEFCRAGVDLTRLENEAIKEAPDIPVLSSEFNSRLLEKIQSSHVQYPAPMEINPAPGRFNMRTVFRVAGSLAAVFLLVLIWPSLLNQNHDIDENTRISEIAPDKQARLYSTNQTGDDNQDMQNNEPPVVQEESKLEAGSDLGAVATGQANKKQPENEMVYGKIPASAPTGEQPRALMSTPREAAGDGAMMYNFSTASQKTSEDPNPSNLPPEYQLVSSNMEGTTVTYTFRKTNSAEEINISISPVAGQNLDAASASPDSRVEDQGEASISRQQTTESKSAATMTVSIPPVSVQKEISFDNQTYNLVISGNLSREELTTIADAIVLNKK